jgi:hypothetical protein
MTRFEDYYAGVQPLPFASAKFRQAFGDRFPAFSSNFMALVVDAHRERLHVQGIRIGDAPEGDADAWRWWQENRLAPSHRRRTESLVQGIASRSSGRLVPTCPRSRSSRPRVVVETEPGKSWAARPQAGSTTTAATGRALSARRHLSSARPGAGGSAPSWASVATWTRDDVGGVWPVANPWAWSRCADRQPAETGGDGQSRSRW